jgi:dTDP-4-dehydrorhamnose reductase
MKILLTGGLGMLGRTLRRRLDDHEIVATDLPEVDVAHLASITAAIAEARPSLVVHCAAMTAVDRCETEVDAAYRANAIGSANVAIACQRAGARLIAISTDYVFDGQATRPYHEWDPTVPRTAYGASKLAGEHAIRTHCPDHVILRTAWLYGPGGPSFLHTMLKVGAEPGPTLKIVEDQVGNPTSTDALADCVRWVIETPVVGTFHASCEGETSWFGFAQAIFDERPSLRQRTPCATVDFPRPAPRPANSRLDKRALRTAGLGPMQHWRDSLARFFTEHPGG